MKRIITVLIPVLTILFLLPVFAGAIEETTAPSSEEEVTEPAHVVHAYGDWRITKGARYTANGEETRTCTVCGATEKRATAKVTLPGPETLTLSKDATGIKVAWSASKSATKYRLYRKEIDSKGNDVTGWKILLTTENNKTRTFIDKKAVNGKRYQYTVRSYREDAYGTAWSPVGVRKNYYCLATPNFTLANRVGGVNVKWPAVSGANGYIVYRKAGGAAKWTKLATLEGNKVRAYYDQNVSNNATYTYTVKAYNSGNYSAFTSKKIIFLATPSKASVSSGTNGVTLKWGSNPAAAGYYIYRESNGGKYSKIATIKDNTRLKYLDGTAKRGGTYRYRVVAYRGSFKSSFWTSAVALNKNTAESYASVVSTVKGLAAEYPNLITVGSAGKSTAGRNLIMMKVGNGSKKALVVGAVHAREHLTTKFTLCLINDYCIAYGRKSKIGGYDIRKLLNTYTLYVVPCANPDGLEIVYSRDNPNSNVSYSSRSEYKANKAGIDLNRNFPIDWGSIHNGVTGPSSYYYKGKTAGDAVETKALMALCNGNDFAFMLSVHVRGDVIWWGNTFDKKGNAVARGFAQKLCDVAGFGMTSALSNPNDYGGGFEDWFRYKFRKPGVCVELCTNTIYPCDHRNYTYFDSMVQYSSSYKVVAAAMGYCT